MLGFYIAAVALLALAVGIGFAWVPLRERRMKRRTTEHIIRGLDKRVSVEFKDEPAEEALSYFRGLLECGITTDPKSTVDPEAKVNMQLKNVPFAAVLDAWCAQVGGDWTIYKSKLFIATPERVAEAERADPYVAGLVREYRAKLAEDRGKAGYGKGAE